jgi:hypothetical protein
MGSKSKHAFRSKRVSALSKTLIQRALQPIRKQHRITDSASADAFANRILNVDDCLVLLHEV